MSIAASPSHEYGKVGNPLDLFGFVLYESFEHSHDALLDDLREFGLVRNSRDAQHHRIVK